MDLQPLQYTNGSGSGQTSMETKLTGTSPSSSSIKVDKSPNTINPRLNQKISKLTSLPYSPQDNDTSIGDRKDDLEGIGNIIKDLN